jgi:hypothetical protein
MTVTEPDAGPAEEPELVQPDVPEPKEWLGKMDDLLEGLDRVGRARTLMAGSTKEESGPDYPIAQELLIALEAAMKGSVATLLVNQTKDRSPGWEPSEQ